MQFDLAVEIEALPGEVFAFLRDKHRHTRKPGSAVRLLDKTTPGPVGIGTRYREVVRMLPWFEGEILSEITGFEENTAITEMFSGPNMTGELTYRFSPASGGTRLIHEQRFQFQGWIRVLLPLIWLAMAVQLRLRLRSIKRILEQGPMG
jgi:hypothetical protein